MDRFGQQQLVMALIGMMALLAGGFLFLLFKTPASVPVEKRRIDFAAEIAAGTLPERYGAGSKKKVEEVNMEGTFEAFDGKPGTTKEKWANFRSADFSNIAKTDVKLAESWPDSGPPELWGIDVGEGYAGAVVWDGRVYLIDYDEEKEVDTLRCFSFDDGKEIWRRYYQAKTKANHGVSRTVPAVTEDVVVSIGPRCHTLCVDRETGDFRWGIDMIAKYGTKVPDWYTGQCPLIDGNTTVLAPCGSALMIGVDNETGDILWETPNPDGWNMSHTSIIPMTVLGRKTYVYSAIGGLVGVSAEEKDRGTVLWKTNAWTHKVAASSPVSVDDSRIFLTVGYGGGSMMMGFKNEGDKIVAEPIFELEKTDFGSEQQTPIFYEGHLFGVLPKDAKALKEQFVCLNTDGKVVWSSGKTERFGLGPYLKANDLFYLLNDHGELTMIKASLTGYEKLAHADVLSGHDAWAPMALVDGKLLLRDSRRMICLDMAAQ